MLTFRAVQLSRLAMLSAFAVGSAMSSSTHAHRHERREISARITKNCVFCGNPFLFISSGSHYVAYRTTSGKLYCNEFCADPEDQENWKARRRKA
jgi:hypothetical protein